MAMKGQGSLSDYKFVISEFSNRERKEAVNYLVNYSRKIIRKEVLRLLPGNGEILEINSGTGTDAVYFASHGFRITATDISPGMIEVIQNKVATLDLHHLVNARECSFWNLDELDDKKYKTKLSCIVIVVKNKNFMFG